MCLVCANLRKLIGWRFSGRSKEHDLYLLEVDPEGLKKNHNVSSLNNCPEYLEHWDLKNRLSNYRHGNLRCKGFWIINRRIGWGQEDRKKPLHEIGFMKSIALIHLCKMAWNPCQSSAAQSSADTRRMPLSFTHRYVKRNAEWQRNAEWNHEWRPNVEWQTNAEWNHACSLPFWSPLFDSAEHHYWQTLSSRAQCSIIWGTSAVNIPCCTCDIVKSEKLLWSNLIWDWKEI